MSTLVVGLGNTDRGDDGIGIAVARCLAARAPAGIEVLEVAEPASLLHTWGADDRVVIIDAVTSGSEPGTVAALDVSHDPLPSDGWTARGTHALGLSAVVEISRTLGTLPRQVVVVGIEVGETEMGADLSTDVAASIGAAADTVTEVLDRQPDSSTLRAGPVART